MEQTSHAVIETWLKSSLQATRALHLMEKNMNVRRTPAADVLSGWNADWVHVGVFVLITQHHLVPTSDNTFRKRPPLKLLSPRTSKACVHFRNMSQGALCCMSLQTHVTAAALVSGKAIPPFGEDGSLPSQQLRERWPSKSSQVESLLISWTVEYRPFFVGGEWWI